MRRTFVGSAVPAAVILDTGPELFLTSVVAGKEQPDGTMKKKKTAAPGTNVVHPNVSRVDYPGTHGYTVRIQRDGKVTNKFFSDSGHKREALAAAISWREATARGIPPMRRIQPPGYSYLKRGICFDYAGDFRYEYAAWVGFLRIEDRKHLVTKWSIDKWGDEEARRRCEDWLARRKADLASRLAGASAKKTRAPKAPAKRKLRA